MLLMPAILWREIEERTRFLLPEEACGLLIGVRRANEWDVAALAPCRNAAADPLRSFELEALDLAAAEDGARDAGLSVIGVWHSHPRGPLAPSAEDVCGASGMPRDWLCVIAVPTHGPTASPAPRREAGEGIELACWRRDGSEFVAVPVGQPIAARQ